MSRMEEISLEKVDKQYAESTKIITVASLFIGTLPIGIRYKAEQTSHLNNLILLTIFVLNFLVVVIWIEILNSPHNTATEITRGVDLFTESFSSIMILIIGLKKKKIYLRMWDLIIEGDAISLSLGINIDYVKLKRQSIVRVICFLVIHISLFATDYFLLTHTSNHTFVLSSFLTLAIHTVHNACCLNVACFVVNFLRERFYFLNAAMRNLQYIDIASLLRELPLNKPISQITLPTMRQQIEKIKTAHDKYAGICDEGNMMLHITLWLQISSNVGVITAKLYTIITMILGQQYDIYILFHCLIWTIYRIFGILILVFTFTLTANEANHIVNEIHDLIDSGRADTVRNYLRHFSMQFLHKKVEFSANKIFPINFSLIYLAISKITTYLVISVQFNVSRGKNDDPSKLNRTCLGK